jgi:hypothetical protein
MSFIFFLMLQVTRCKDRRLPVLAVLIAAGPHHVYMFRLPNR